jgi:hypothetical protein
MRVFRRRAAADNQRIFAMDKRSYWVLVLCTSAILMITMGVRQSLGLFVSPLNTSTGLGIVTISFALAVGQFVWGGRNRCSARYSTARARCASLSSAP